MSSNRALSSSVTLIAYLIVLFFVLLALIYSPGCSDEELITNLTEKTVAGKISGREGAPLGGVMVSVNGGEAVMTSSYGSFSIAGVEPPYDLNVFHAPRPFFYQFHGVTTLEPDIELDVSALDVLENYAIVDVAYPKVASGQFVMFRFITGLHSRITVESQTDSTARLRIKWEGQSYINGDLAMLQAVKDAEQRIVSYEKFAAKMIWVQNALQYEVFFTASELQFNPGESSMQITAPAGIVFRNLKVKMLFKSFPFSSGFEIIDEEFPASLSFVVPSGLPYPVKISYELDPIDTLNGFDLSAKGFMEPGENYNITLPPSFNLMYPAADTTGVNYSTYFSHNNTGKIYEFTIGPYNIITNGSVILLPHTEEYGISLPSNSLLFWQVKQHNADNMDEFVKKRDMSYPTSHNIVIGTPIRLFTTGVMK